MGTRWFTSELILLMFTVAAITVTVTLVSVYLTLLRGPSCVWTIVPNDSLIPLRRAMDG